MKRGSGCCAVDIYCTAALTSFSDSISYLTYLFSEWRITVCINGHNSMIYPKQGSLYERKLTKTAYQNSPNLLYSTKAYFAIWMQLLFYCIANNFVALHNDSVANCIATYCDTYYYLWGLNFIFSFIGFLDNLQKNQRVISQIIIPYVKLLYFDWLFLAH